jgi:hypothetical protein
VEQLRAAGFCGIHVDARGFKGEGYQVVSDDLTKRFGPAVASGNEDKWRTFWLGDNDTPRDPSTWSPELIDAFSPPMITPDNATVAPRGSLLNLTWWWTIAPEATFTLTPVAPTAPLGSVSGQLRSPSCGPATVTVTLTAGARTKFVEVDAQPKTSTPFELTLDAPTTEPATLTISSGSEACNVAEFPYPQYAQVIDLTPTVGR